LIALLDATHAFHARAHIWWSANAAFGWASCPLTEIGVTRIMANPAFSPSVRFTAAQICQSLHRFVAGTNHEFWPDDLTFRNPEQFLAERIHGARQLTDLYLLGLAVKRGGRLATFDQGIPLSAVKNARAGHLCVL
jgi:uncharacterized protein